MINIWLVPSRTSLDQEKSKQVRSFEESDNILKSHWKYSIIRRKKKHAWNLWDINFYLYLGAEERWKGIRRMESSKYCCTGSIIRLLFIIIIIIISGEQWVLDFWMRPGSLISIPSLSVALNPPPSPLTLLWWPRWSNYLPESRRNEELEGHKMWNTSAGSLRVHDVHST